MLRLTGLICLVALLFCAQLSAQKMDTTASTIDAYKNGTVKASYWVQLHDDPAAGQYWETKMDMAGDMTMTTRWQIAKVDGTTAVVENQMKMDGPYMTSDYVIAYQVDLEKEGGDANVTKAWIGKPGEKGTEIEVMEKPEVSDSDVPEGEEPETEEFTNLELAGGVWEGKIYIHGSSRTWMATNGWFGGMVKMESEGATIALAAFGEDSKALLKWDEAEENPKDDEKKDDAKTGEKKEPAKDGEKKDDAKKKDK